jgi:hypothetical protein
VSALFLIEPELFGTNNSGPLSPTKVGDPCCKVPSTVKLPPSQKAGGGTVQQGSPTLVGEEVQSYLFRIVLVQLKIMQTQNKW